MVFPELVEAQVHELRSAMDEMRKVMTATIMRTDTLEHRARTDGGTIAHLEASVHTLQTRVVGLSQENEELKSLLREVVTWLDQALVQNGHSGLSEEMRASAAVLSARIHRSENF